MKILNSNRKSPDSITHIWDNIFYYITAQILTGFDYYLIRLRVELVFILHNYILKIVIFAIFSYKLKNV